MTPTLTTTDTIRAYITEELLFGQEEVDLSDDDNLLLSGLLDSLGIMRLVTFLEEEFATDIPPGDVTIDHFLTITHIARYLEARLEARLEG